MLRDLYPKSFPFFSGSILMRMTNSLLLRKLLNKFRAVGAAFIGHQHVTKARDAEINLSMKRPAVRYYNPNFNLPWSFHDAPLPHVISSNFSPKEVTSFLKASCNKFSICSCVRYQLLADLAESTGTSKEGGAWTHNSLVHPVGLSSPKNRQIGVFGRRLKTGNSADCQQFFRASGT
jgi:hypothetical protein